MKKTTFQGFIGVENIKNIHRTDAIAFSNGIGN